MADLIGCQCPRGMGAQCDRAATQEDFLCDVCRGGCGTLRAGWNGQWHTLAAHAELAPWPQVAAPRD